MGYVIVMIPLNLIESIKSYLAENSGTVYGSPEKKMHKDIVDSLRRNPGKIAPDITDVFKDVDFLDGFGAKVNIDLVALSQDCVYFIEARSSSSGSRSYKANLKLRKALFSFQERFPGAALSLYRAYMEHGKIKLEEVPIYDRQQRVMTTFHIL